MDTVTLALAKKYTDSQSVLTSTDKLVFGVLLPFNDGTAMQDYASGVFVVGNTYTVLWDGTEYKCKCVSFVSPDGEGLALGNLAPLGGVDSGEPFLMFEPPDFLGFLAIPDMGTGGTTFHEIIVLESVEKIDPKYIPALDSVTLNSPNGTQFKITVDDTGALTATEV